MSGHFVSPSFMADADAAELAALCDGLTETHANRLILLWRQMAQLTADIAAHCDPEPAANVVGLFEHRARRSGHPCISDDAPVRGYPRPSADAVALAAEEMRHSITSGDYFDADDGA